MERLGVGDVGLSSAGSIMIRRQGLSCLGQRIIMIMCVVRRKQVLRGRSSVRVAVRHIAGSGGKGHLKMFLKRVPFFPFR